MDDGLLSAHIHVILADNTCGHHISDEIFDKIKYEISAGVIYDFRTTSIGNRLHTLMDVMRNAALIATGSRRRINGLVNGSLTL